MNWCGVTASADKQVLAGLLACEPDVVVNRLTGQLGQLEPNRSTGLLLPHSGSVGGVAVRSNVLDLDGHDIATAWLAVDGQVEHGEVARSPIDLQPRPD
jgi:hypothetical protein